MNIYDKKHFMVLNGSATNATDIDTKYKHFF